MARPNRPRAIGGEENLALRIAAEREQRCLSYEALAQAMTERGCPIQKSALQKIEKGKPRRGIKVDELIALADVFDVEVQDLLTDMELIRKRHLQQVVARLDPAEDSLIQAVTDVMQVWIDFWELAADDPDGWEYVTNHWFGGIAEDEVTSAVLVNAPPGFDEAPFREGLLALGAMVRETAASLVEASLNADAEED